MLCDKVVFPCADTPAVNGALRFPIKYWLRYKNYSIRLQVLNCLL